MSVSHPDFLSLFLDLADSSLNFVLRDRADRMIDYDGRKVGHAKSLQRQFGLLYELSRDDRGRWNAQLFERDQVMHRLPGNAGERHLADEMEQDNLAAFCHGDPVS